MRSFMYILSEVHILDIIVDEYRYCLSLDILTQVHSIIINNNLFYLPYNCSTILQGKTSHKFVDMSENPIMRLYYTDRTVLFVMCMGNEMFYASLYLLYFTTGPLSKFAII